MALGNADTVARGVLTNAGLLTCGDRASHGGQAPAELADAVRIAVMLDEQPDELSA